MRRCVSVAKTQLHTEHSITRSRLVKDRGAATLFCNSPEHRGKDRDTNNETPERCNVRANLLPQVATDCRGGNDKRATNQGHCDQGERKKKKTTLAASNGAAWDLAVVGHPHP